MIQTMCPVFDIDGEDYVVDTSMSLASLNPPRYNAHRLKDRALLLVEVSRVVGSRYMTRDDMYHWLARQMERPRIDFIPKSADELVRESIEKLETVVNKLEELNRRVEFLERNAILSSEEK